MGKACRTVAILAGKGGVGKSFVTLQIARGLQAKGFRVGVLDADIHGPSAQLLFPADKLPTVSDDGWVEPAVSAHIQVMSVAYLKGWSDLAVVRAPIANALIEQFAKEVRWDDLDFLLVDFPPGTGDVPITITQTLQLDAAILVSAPHTTATADVIKAGIHMQQAKVPILALIENMAAIELDHGQWLELFGPSQAAKVIAAIHPSHFLQMPLVPQWSSMAARGEALVSAGYTHPWQAQWLSLLDQLSTSMAADSPNSTVQLTIENGGDSLKFCSSNGDCGIISAAELLELCPCCACKNVPKKQALSSTHPQIRTLEQLGSYGFTVSVEGGCSKGIYPYSILYQHCCQSPSVAQSP